jgi:hypothetical protein
MNENLTNKATPEQHEKLELVRVGITKLFLEHNLDLNEGLSVLLQVAAISVATVSSGGEAHIEILKKYLSKIYQETLEQLKNDQI